MHTADDGAETVCSTTSPDLWHHPDHHYRRDAVALCLGCPSLAPCRRYRTQSMAGGQRLYGVWAGIDHGMTDGKTRKGARQP